MYGRWFWQTETKEGQALLQCWNLEKNSESKLLQCTIIAWININAECR